METQFTEEQFETYSEEVLALAQYLGCDPEEISEEGNDRYSIGNNEYLVCDDATAEQYWDDELDMYLDECVYPELPNNMVQYFDDEKWKRDVRYDGRGHSLGHYDGCENEERINGTDYYIYRQN
jgi:hypothetical protein